MSATSTGPTAAALSAFIDGIGLLGPGLPDWPAAAAALRSPECYQPARTELPAPQSLPPAERRRATASVKLTLATGREALAMSGRAADGLRTVFAGSGGDGLNCHVLCEALASSDRLISPTRFHNSVHNAPSGYWGIAMHAMAASTVLCAPHDGSFAAGLLDALVQVRTSGADVLLLVYDTDYPEPLRSARPIPDSFGVALLLAPQPAAVSVARVAVDPSSACLPAPADGLGHPGLEALRAAVPAARSLVLLDSVARAAPARVRLDYLPGRPLEVDVSPC